MITLRSIKEADLSQLVILANNKKISDNLSDMMPYPYTLDDGKAFLELHASQKKVIRKAIIYNGEFCGLIGVHPQQDIRRHTAELGYWIGEPFWNKGVATEAIKQILDIVWSETELIKIFASVFEHNKASAQVLIKNGFVYEGTFKKGLIKHGKVYNELRYGLVRG